MNVCKFKLQLQLSTTMHYKSIRLNSQCLFYWGRLAQESRFQSQRKEPGLRRKRKRKRKARPMGRDPESVGWSLGLLVLTLFAIITTITGQPAITISIYIQTYASQATCCSFLINSTVQLKFNLEMQSLWHSCWLYDLSDLLHWFCRFEGSQKEEEVNWLAVDNCSGGGDNYCTCWCRLVN